MPFGIGKLFGSAADDVVSSVGNVLDSVFTSDEERGEIAVEQSRIELAKQRVEAEIRMRFASIAETIAEQRGAAVQAEIQGESWLQRSWRPLVMLAFTATIMMHWLGIAGTDLAPEVQGYVYGIIKLGLGGYVIGRSGEKIVKTAAPHLSRRSEPDAP